TRHARSSSPSVTRSMRFATPLGNRGWHIACRRTGHRGVARKRFLQAAGEGDTILKTAHIGILTAYGDVDWHAQQLAAAARRRGRVSLIAPHTVAAEIVDGTSRVYAGGLDARAYDVILTPRAIGDLGDADFQIEAYRVMAELGCVLV